MATLQGAGPGLRPDLRRVRAALFDLDGTLVRQCIDFREMRRRVVGILERGGAYTEALGALHVLEMIERATADLARCDAARAAALRMEAEQSIVALEVEATEHAAPLPGAAALLEALRRRGLGVGIVTRNCRPAVERVLARHALSHDVLLTRDDVQSVKPDPQHLLDALAALGVRGDEALMCGDHPMDILAGQRAGAAATVGALPEGQDDAYFASVAPDLVVRRVDELAPYLGLRLDGR